jgi:hypothetical protein
MLVATKWLSGAMNFLNSANDAIVGWLAFLDLVEVCLNPFPERLDC